MWKTELGPRQVKPARALLSALQSEGKTFINLTGTHGKPDTERRSTYNSPLDPNVRPDVVAVLHSLQTRFEPLTVQNLDEFLAVANQALAQLREQRPIRDERITLAEDEKRAQRAAENFAQEEARRQRAPEAKSTVDLTVKHNVGKDGVEIYFATKPERAVLEQLKASGWRWSMRSSCWYKRHSPEAWAEAHAFAGKTENDAEKPWSAPVTAWEAGHPGDKKAPPPKEPVLTLRDFAKRFFPGYRGRKFKLRIDPGGMSLVSCWSGGSRDSFVVVRLEDMQAVPIPENGSGFSAVDRQYGAKGLPVKLPAPGFAVIEHSIFCGKDVGLTVHLHPDNAARMVEGATA